MVLLGDSAHAMQPNLGQGGCMAIEDAYQLVLDLGQEAERAAEHSGAAAQMNVEGVLSGYMRVGPAFGMAAVGGHWLRVGCCDGMLALTGRLPRACPTALLNSAMRNLPYPAPNCLPCPQKRVMRAASIHGMAGMAAYMASTYKAYLGEGLGPLSWITRYKIPHPGRVAGQVG